MQGRNIRAYGEEGVPDAEHAAAQVARPQRLSAGDDLEGGQAGVGRVGDPAAVGRYLAQRR